jgi:hypothetical protein
LTPAIARDIFLSRGETLFMDNREIEAYLNRRLGGFVVWGLQFFPNAPIYLVIGPPASSAREAYLRIECRWCLHERETEYSDWHDDTDLRAMLKALETFARNVIDKIILTDAWNVTFCLNPGSYLTLEATHRDFENWEITSIGFPDDFTIVGLAGGEIAIFDKELSAEPGHGETHPVERPAKKWWPFWK